MRVSVQVQKYIKRTEDQPGQVVFTEASPLLVQLAAAHAFLRADHDAAILSVVQRPLHYSNVQLVDPVTGRPVRVQYRFTEDGTKVLLHGLVVLCIMVQVQWLMCA